jgi:hypothetical protein
VEEAPAVVLGVDEGDVEAVALVEWRSVASWNAGVMWPCAGNGKNTR